MAEAEPARENPINWDARDPDGRTTLMRMVHSGASEELIRKALAQGADVRTVDLRGRTVLHHACLTSGSHREIPTIVAFLVQAGADPSGVDDQGRTPLLAAFAEGGLEMKVLWELASNHLRPQDPEVRDQEGRSLIDYSVGSRDPLIRSQFGEEFWAKLIPEPWRIFNLAVLAGVCDLKTLKKAVLAGRGPSDLNSSGETCLFAAVDCLLPGVFRYLLSLRPDLEHQDTEGRTVLFRTVSRSSLRLDATRLLLKAGASVHVRDSQGFTPLHLAVRTRDLRLIKYLLAFGAQPDIEDGSGETPFEVSCRFNTSRRILKSLFKRVPRRQQGLLLQRGLRLAFGACVERHVVESLVRLGATLSEELLVYAQGWKYWRDLNLDSIGGKAQPGFLKNP